MSRSIDALSLSNPEHSDLAASTADHVTVPEDAEANGLDLDSTSYNHKLSAEGRSDEDLTGPPQLRNDEATNGHGQGTPESDDTDITRATAFEVSELSGVALAGAGDGNSGDMGSGYGGGHGDGPGDRDDSSADNESDDNVNPEQRLVLPPRELTSRELPPATASRLAHDRAEIISQAYRVIEDDAGTDGRRSPLLNEVDTDRSLVSKVLLHDSASPRYVVGVEEERVASLLDETYTDPHAGEARAMQFGRELMERAGLRTPNEPQLVDRPFLEADQAARREAVHEELTASRDLLRDRINPGIDGLVIDEYLGLRENHQTLLPDHFKHVHQQAEADTGRRLSFTEWMSDHATDDQLLNVWQWHDHYLRTLDEAPEYQSQIERVTQGYADGVDAAIADGTLHPSMRHEGNGDGVTIRHGSPFSPLMAVGYAYVDPDLRTIYTRQGVTDYSMFHERTHLEGGLGSTFDEGATELITYAVYSRSGTVAEPYGIEGSAYRDNIATLVSLDMMTGRHVGLYGISEFYAGPYRQANAAAFAIHVDDEIGLPVCQQVITNGRELHAELAANLDLGSAALATQLSMRLESELMESALVDPYGNRIHLSMSEIAQRIVSEDNITRYGPGVVLRSLKTVALASLQSGEQFET
jgi:hypothetical protein